MCVGHGDPGGHGDLLASETCELTLRSVCASFGRPALPRTLASIGETPEVAARTVDAWYFGDNAADANGLAALVVQGAKRATSPSLWKLGAQDLPVSQPGDLHIVTDWDGVAQCLIRTTQIGIVPFNDVPASHAALAADAPWLLGGFLRQHHKWKTSFCAADWRSKPVRQKFLASAAS